MLANRYDFIDVFDVDRTSFLAGAAGVTGPNDFVDHGFVFADDDVELGVRTAFQELRLEVVQVISQIQQKLTRGEGLPGRGGRTKRRAATALGAAVHVERLLPTKMLRLGTAERRSLDGKIGFGQPSLRFDLTEENVGYRGDDVKVFGARK